MPSTRRLFLLAAVMAIAAYYIVALKPVSAALQQPAPGDRDAQHRRLAAQHAQRVGAKAEQEEEEEEEVDVWSQIRATALAEAARKHPHRAVHAAHLDEAERPAPPAPSPTAAAPSHDKGRSRSRTSSQQKTLPQCPPQQQPLSISSGHAPGESRLDKLLRWSYFLAHHSWRLLTLIVSTLIVAPLRFVVRSAHYGARGTIRTTLWTGDRAIVTPARVALAPLSYLIQGLAFIFIWIPWSIIRVIVRELYPVYVFLGAALALGTAMGVASAVVLYLGSFIFSDRSSIETAFSRRAKQGFDPLVEATVVKNGSKRGAARGRRGSPGDKRRGESVVLEGLREAGARGWTLDDDEEYDDVDDYLAGAGSGASHEVRRSTSSRRRKGGPLSAIRIGGESDEEDDALFRHEQRMRGGGAAGANLQAYSGHTSRESSDSPSYGGGASSSSDYFGSVLPGQMAARTFGPPVHPHGGASASSKGKGKAQTTTPSTASTRSTPTLSPVGNVSMGLPSASSPSAAPGGAALSGGARYPVGATSRSGWGHHGEGSGASPYASLTNTPLVSPELARSAGGNSSSSSRRVKS